MQQGHGWRPNGALASAMNDDITFALGRQSAFITTRPNRHPAALTRTDIRPRVDLTGGRYLRLLIRVENGDNIADCSVYVSSDGMVANYAYAPIQNINADPSVRWLKDGEWKWVTVSLASATMVGRPHFSAIDSVRIRAVSQAGTSMTVRLQAAQVIEPTMSEGIVCFTYDDSYRSQCTVAKAQLDRYGLPGTAYTISSNVQAADAGDSRYLTTRMLQQMRQESRWEIAPHAHTVTDHARAFACGYDPTSGVSYGTNPLSPTELDLDVSRNLDWLTTNGLLSGFVGHCYPRGRFNTAVQRQLAGRVAYARAMTSDSNGVETLPPADPYAIRCYPLNNTTRLATVRAIVDGVATYGGAAVFCCHDIVPVPTQSTQCSIALHRALVSYAATHTGVRVATLGSVMRQLAPGQHSTSPL